MLHKPMDDIIMENGKVVGVKSEGEVVMPCAFVTVAQLRLSLFRAMFIGSLIADKFAIA